MTLLAGRRIVVSGAGGALGAVIMTTANGRGAQVFGAGHDMGDLADSAVAERILAEAASAMGGVDGLVNVAGGFDFARVADGELALWEDLFRKNLLTAVAMSKAAVARMGAGSAIVNIAAAGGLKAEAGMGPYAASKSAVMRLTEALAAEQRKHGIRVNSILPTTMDTPANRAAMPKADTTGWVSLEAVADLACFLLSDLSRATSGGHVVAGG
jgi:NAD(P)-dependent dehydrogenase (short-subunit alcohol dehydrogenase family)